MYFKVCDSRSLTKCMNGITANRCYDNTCFCGNELECNEFARCIEPDKSLAKDHSHTATCQIG